MIFYNKRGNCDSDTRPKSTEHLQMFVFMLEATKSSEGTKASSVKTEAGQTNVNSSVSAKCD